MDGANQQLIADCAHVESLAILKKRMEAYDRVFRPRSSLLLRGSDGRKFKREKKTECVYPDKTELGRFDVCRSGKRLNKTAFQ